MKKTYCKFCGIDVTEMLLGEFENHLWDTHDKEYRPRWSQFIRNFSRKSVRNKEIKTS